MDLSSDVILAYKQNHRCVRAFAVEREEIR